MATCTNKELTEFLYSYDVNGSGAFNREQWLNLCTGRIMKMPEDSAAELFDRLDTDKDGKVKIDELLMELTEWQNSMQNSQNESDYMHFANGSPNKSQHNGHKTMPETYGYREYQRDRNYSVYESTPEEVNMDFKKSLYEANRLNELISESYPELASPFQRMLQSFNQEITEKQSEQDFLEESYQSEKLGRKQDLDRLEKELDGQLQLVEDRLRNEIRTQLEAEYQEKIIAKEQETKRLQNAVADLKQQVYKNARKRSTFNMQDEEDEEIPPSPRSPRGNKIRTQLSAEELAKNDKLAEEAIKLRNKLREATEQLEASEQELKELSTRLECQTSELLVERMKCSTYIEEKDLLHCQVQKMRDALQDMVEKQEMLKQRRLTEIHDNNSPDSLPPDSGKWSGNYESSLAEANDKRPFTDSLPGHESAMSGWSNVDNMQAPDRIFRIIMVGDSSVGKTCFMHRFCTGEFLLGARSTVGVDFKTKNIVIDGNTFAIELWDTAGQEKFHSVAKQYFRKCDGAILMYDVSTRNTFLGVREWINILAESTMDDTIPRILVANKCDIRDSPHSSTNQLLYITTEMGRNLAKIYNTEFMETSVLNYENVDEAVVILARAMKAREVEMQSRDGVRLSMSRKRMNLNCCKPN